MADFGGNGEFVEKIISRKAFRNRKASITLGKSRVVIVQWIFIGQAGIDGNGFYRFRVGNGQFVGIAFLPYRGLGVYFFGLPIFVFYLNGERNRANGFLPDRQLAFFERCNAHIRRTEREEPGLPQPCQVLARDIFESIEKVVGRRRLLRPAPDVFAEALQEGFLTQVVVQHRVDKGRQGIGCVPIITGIHKLGGSDQRQVADGPHRSLHLGGCTTKIEAFLFVEVAADDHIGDVICPALVHPGKAFFVDAHIHRKIGMEHFVYSNAQAGVAVVGHHGVFHPAAALGNEGGEFRIRVGNARNVFREVLHGFLLIGSYLLAVFRIFGRVEAVDEHVPAVHLLRRCVPAVVVAQAEGKVRHLIGLVMPVSGLVFIAALQVFRPDDGNRFHSVLRLLITLEYLGR